jgi:RNA polymerase sigma-70 factor, ECF subfamily
VGAVKAALHRARGKLVEPPVEEPIAPAAAVLDAFCEAFNAGDLEGLTALLLDSASAQVVGATTQYGPEGPAGRCSTGCSSAWRAWSRPTSTAAWNRASCRASCRGLRGSRRARIAVLLHWYAYHDGDAVRALTRIEADGDRVASLRNYFFNPDLVAEVCGELGLPSRANGHRWCLPARSLPDAST